MNRRYIKPVGGLNHECRIEGNAEKNEEGLH